MKKKYGTSRGVKLTDELIKRLADEAVAGYDRSRLAQRPRRGRPSMGSEAATVFQVRLEPELREALDKRAKAEHTTPSELARRLLRAQLTIKRTRRRRSG